MVLTQFKQLRTSLDGAAEQKHDTDFNVDQVAADQQDFVSKASEERTQSDVSGPNLVPFNASQEIRIVNGSVFAGSDSEIVVRLLPDQVIAIRSDSAGNAVVSIENDTTSSKLTTTTASTTTTTTSTTTTSTSTLPKEKLFVIVAYRDRAEHKKVFLTKMNEYLKRKV